jgi:flagellar protein FlaH
MTHQIMLVDNGTESARANKSMLEQEGYEVTTVTTGHLALKKAAEDLPDLLLIDTGLPDMGWNELCRSLRAEKATEKVPIIVLSSSATLNDLTIGGESYADDFMVKPFGSLELQQKVLPLLNDKSRQGRVVISTGNGELDLKMGGGIPLGSLTLIEGSSGAGKSVLVQQMIWGSLHNSFQLSVFTTENTIKSLIRQMRSLSLDVLDYLLLNRLRVYQLEVASMGAEAPHFLLDAIGQKGHCDLVFVDSLTSAIAQSSSEGVLSFFEGCKRLCTKMRSVVIVLHSHAVGGELLIRLRSLCDAHLQLRTEQVGDKMVRTMEVSKIRGADQTTGNIVSFEVEPGWGMRLVPINKVKG